MSGFAEALHDRLLLCDGAMGTMLHAAGNSLDKSLPELNLSQPELVSTVHDSYIGAGVDVILTNTFGASRWRLDEHGCGDKVAEINRAGVRLARQAAAAVRRNVYVGGSVAPAVAQPSGRAWMRRNGSTACGRKSWRWPTLESTCSCWRHSAT